MEDWQQRENHKKDVSSLRIRTRSMRHSKLNNEHRDHVQSATLRVIIVLSTISSEVWFEFESTFHLDLTVDTVLHRPTYTTPARPPLPCLDFTHLRHRLVLYTSRHLTHSAVALSQTAGDLHRNTSKHTEEFIARTDAALLIYQELNDKTPDQHSHYLTSSRCQHPYPKSSLTGSSSGP